jgi:hypothetical protein
MVMGLLFTIVGDIFSPTERGRYVGLFSAVLLRNPVISICSMCVFVVGMGMFGVIIYLPLFIAGAGASGAGDVFFQSALLVQLRPQIEATIARTPGGLLALGGLSTAVRTSLAHGLEQIFLWSAIIMSAAVVLHLAMRSEPLRTRMVEPGLTE